MRIRRAVDDDAPAVTAVVGAAYSGYVARIGRAPAPMGADYESLIAAGEVWVGDSGGSVVGVLVIRSSDEILELENVAVDPAEQGLGHGRALIAFAESHARELGLTAVELYTNEAMVENLRLYPRLGFVETGRRVEGGYRRVYFRKTLDAGSSRR
jgi:ribosomal protein S18 acetylase RimI-like enzyme